MKGYILTLLLFIQCLVYTQITGKVIDANTKEPLPFVNIKLNNRYSTSSDIDGNFKISSSNIDSIHFSYVGYQSKVMSGKGKSYIHVSLYPKTYNLKDLIILPEENPALRIIRNVIDNRDINDVENTDYQCELYNLLKVNIIIDTNKYKVLPDSLVNHRFKDSAGQQVCVYCPSSVKYQGKLYDLDSVMSESEYDLLGDRPLLTLETFVDKKHLAPDRDKEVVKASKMSGFKNPSFMALATKIQSFSFYKNYFEISDNQFLSPISKAGLRNYFYYIEDTLYMGQDSVFVISFRPYKGKDFDGMKGTLQISSSSWAIKNVIAEPWDTNTQMPIKIQQLYEQDDQGKWVPQQLLGEMDMRMISIGSFGKVVGEIRTYIDSFDYSTRIRNRDVDNIAFEIAPDAHKKDSSEWEDLRKTDLTEKEKNALMEMLKDSLPSSMSFDRMLDAFRYFSSGKIPVGVFSIDLDKVISYNDFEGLRLGMGVHTNERLSKWIQVGVFFGYGLRDRQFKYGGDVNFQIDKKSEVNFKTSYEKEVIASGFPTFYKEGEPLLTPGDYSYIFINKMDNIHKLESTLSFRTLRYLKIHLFGNVQKREVNDEYVFQRDVDASGNPILEQSHLISEYGIYFRWAHKETFYYDGLDKFSLGTKYPILYGKISSGFSSQYGNLKYMKYDFKLSDKIKLGELGISNIALNVGFVDGNVPYSLLYNSPGFYVPFSISSDNGFETMRINEFLSDRYLNIFFRHKFKAFTISRKFQPQLEAIFNYGIGSLQEPQHHLNIAFKTLEKGYSEAGVRIHNLLQVGLTSFGFGGYYRLGPYSFNEFKNNIVGKFVLGFKF